MKDREFFEMCYRQYVREMDRADSLYQHLAIPLLAFPLLAAGIYKFGRTDLLPSLFTRIDVFQFYIATAAGAASLAVAIAYLLRCLYPRTYPALASMKEWQDYREQVLGGTSDPEAPSAPDQPPENEVRTALLEKMNTAEEEWSCINEKRKKQSQSSLYWAGMAVVAIGCQAVFALVIHLQGI